MSLKNFIHNAIIHPLLPMAELLSCIGIKWLSIIIWQWHEESRDDLRHFEDWYSTKCH